MADFNLFSVPDYYGGLLGEEGVQKLQRQALGTGLINAALGFIAQPRNQRYGSALPYLGKALAAGYESGQNVIAGGLRDYETQQKIAEMKRKQEQQQALQGMIGNIQDPNEKLFAQLAPEQYVAAKLKPQTKAFTILNEEQAKAYGLPTDRGQKYQLTESGAQLIGGTEVKEATATELDKLIAKRNEIAQKNPNDPSLKLYDAKIKKETEPSAGIQVTYGAPVAGVDGQGNPVFFQPSKAGGTPTIVSGVTPLREEKPATEAQAKAGAYASQMRTATDEYMRLEKEGYDPAKATTQAVTSLAGTPLTFLADPQAQQANQAQQQWSEAYLRFKTGAAATKDEVIRNMRTFFPQVGDKPETIAQKARARQQAEKDVASAGKQPSTLKQNAPETRSKADILKQYGL
jgi:hypothetical protein